MQGLSGGEGCGSHRQPLLSLCSPGFDSAARVRGILGSNGNVGHTIDYRIKSYFGYRSKRAGPARGKVPGMKVLVSPFGV